MGKINNAYGIKGVRFPHALQCTNAEIKTNKNK